MKRTIVGLLVIALAGPATAQEAAALYKERCAMCHGASGQATPVGKKMGAQDLTMTKLSAADATRIITDGKGKMPAYKSKLSAAQIDELAKYVADGLKQP